MRYPDGMWNEWYVMFDNGNTAWLGDASGQYTITAEAPGAHNFPQFASLIPAHSYMLNGYSYTASDVRSAECIGGQGELPFQVGAGYQTQVADLRNAKSFITLDYADPGQPKMYVGQAVTLDELKCQLLRDDEQVKAASEQFKGKLQDLACPHCGSSTTFLPGLTTTIICPSCHSQLDTSGSIAQVLAIGKSVDQISTTLALGAQANISGRQFQIIGLMRLCDNENTVWTEYLLHSPKAGFLWIIETDEGWARAMVMDEWPIWAQEDVAVLGNATFKKLYRYPARVIYAIGAFNWRVALGYHTENVEFQNGQIKLAAEITNSEITWSQSAPVSVDQIHAWFGDKVDAHKIDTRQSATDISTKFIWLIILLNIVPVFLTPWALFPILVGLAALYYPAKFLDSLDK
jgi:ribosomal protein S27E